MDAEKYVSPARQKMERELIAKVSKQMYELEYCRYDPTPRSLCPHWPIKLMLWIIITFFITYGLGRYFGCLN